MWENIMGAASDEFPGLSELFVSESTDPSLDWVTMMHPSEPVQPFTNVVDLQKYISDLGFKAQLALLASSNEVPVGAMWRISEIVRLANDQTVINPAFIYQDTSGPVMDKYAQEIKKVIWMEVFNAKYTGFTFHT